MKKMLLLSLAFLSFYNVQAYDLYMPHNFNSSSVVAITLPTMLGALAAYSAGTLFFHRKKDESSEKSYFSLSTQIPAVAIGIFGGILGYYLGNRLSIKQTCASIDLPSIAKISTTSSIVNSYGPLNEFMKTLLSEKGKKTLPELLAALQQVIPEDVDPAILADIACLKQNCTSKLSLILHGSTFSRILENLKHYLNPDLKTHVHSMKAAEWINIIKW